MKRNDMEDAANRAVMLIADASSRATTAIANAALEASKVLSNDAQTAAKAIADKAITDKAITDKDDRRDNADHDLLVRLNEKIEGIKIDIKDLKDGTSHRIEELEKCKVDIKESYLSVYKPLVDKELLDHEKRLRNNETNINRIMTIGSICVVAVNIFIEVMFKYVR